MVFLWRVTAAVAVLLLIITVMLVVKVQTNSSASFTGDINNQSTTVYLRNTPTETAIAKTPKAGDTQVPDETEAADTAPTATAAAVVEPTSTPVPTQDEGDTDIVTEYPVPDSYTLHSGEFIFCLARRFNILPEDLMDYNGYEYGTLLFPGDTILLPPNGRAYLGDRALQYHPADYTVIYGDTLYSIACLYGDVDPRSIAAANDLDIDQVLTPGTVLQIP